MSKGRHHLPKERDDLEIEKEEIVITPSPV
jgi:hypothetical protein